MGGLEVGEMLLPLGSTFKTMFVNKKQPKNFKLIYKIPDCITLTGLNCYDDIDPLVTLSHLLTHCNIPSNYITFIEPNLNSIILHCSNQIIKEKTKIMLKKGQSSGIVENLTIK